MVQVWRRRDLSCGFHLEPNLEPLAFYAAGTSNFAATDTQSLGGHRNTANLHTWCSVLCWGFSGGEIASALQSSGLLPRSNLWTPVPQCPTGPGHPGLGFTGHSLLRGAPALHGKQPRAAEPAPPRSAPLRMPGPRSGSTAWVCRCPRSGARGRVAAQRETESGHQVSGPEETRYSRR